ncbi:PstS family phosphate ABC transporter substrate-binding protein [Paracerasibacillus soli]|uniref:Phosphate-binding protein n=2 Tax=Paracerasibacillus soli TaxID=480284 RepID=A0ABU5CW52_9BACI|nr:PstS family phosphate ABC transporter substrate-binding protein [Virgibacillus soli]MDY0409660.1 PstS family phosphate ABC transporter substrate-binding protein [Virgibacillus soli]
MFMIGAVITTACSDKVGADEPQKKADTEEKASDGSKDSAEKSKETAALSGSVVIDGSGTVYPLMARIAEEYMLTEQEGVSVEVSRAGTSAGFKKFLEANGTDFNDASRQIKEEEQAKADELGIEIKELKVALDGLTFVINKENDWATEMTAEDIKKIFLADGDITKWSDINSDWPDEEINTYGPNENHGTYEFFYENVLEEQDLMNNVNLQQEYSTLVKLISDDKNGIAFFGFGYYATNQDVLQAVAVDFGEGAIVPSLDTIAEDGDYAPFTRPVFTYLNVNHAIQKPQVLDFAKYALDNINVFAGETGFAPIPHDEIQENLDFLEELK